MIKIRSVQDIATTVIGTNASVKLLSFHPNSPYGGDILDVAPDNTPVVEGYTYRSQDGKILRRRLSETGNLMLKHFGWTPETRGEVGELVNKLFASAAKAGVPAELPKSAILRCSRFIAIPEGLTRIVGNNSFLFFIADPAWGESPKEIGVQSRNSSCVIDSMHIDYDTVDTKLVKVAGFWHIDADGLELNDCNINSKNSHGILTRTYGSAKRHSRNVKIRRCIVHTQYPSNDAKQCLLFDVDGVGKMDGYWKENKSIKKVHEYGHDGHVVEDNEFWGGRYGHGFYTSHNCISRRNVCVNNMRGVVYQNSSSGNICEDMRAYQTESSMILLGYESVRNKITRVFGVTDKANSQGFVQMNVGAEDNEVTDCVFENTSIGGMNFCLYVGINGLRNKMKRIKLRATCKNVLLAVESVWNKAERVGYGETISGAAGSWASAHTEGNEFHDIELESDNSVPAILIHAGADESGQSYDVIGTVIKNVKVVGQNHTKDVWMLEDGEGKIKDTVFVGNKVNPEKSVFGDLNMYDDFSMRQRECNC